MKNHLNIHISFQSSEVLLKIEWITMFGIYVSTLLTSVFIPNPICSTYRDYDLQILYIEKINLSRNIDE